MPGKKRKALIPALVVTLVCLDQLTKFLAQRMLAPGGSIPVIRGVFHLSLVHNRGAAFGILKNQLPLFVLTSVVTIFLIYLNLKKPGTGRRAHPVSLGLILAGALGNLIDRLLHGYVIDFLDFRVWPVFNIADSAITIGALLLGYVILTTKEQACTR